MNLSEIQIGFLGTGKMATALAAGFTRRLVKPTSIRGADPLESSRTAFAESIGDGPFVSDDAVSALKDTDVLFLSVKPQTMKSALKSIEAVFQKDKLVVSIAAGLTISTLEGWLPNGTR
ncbi:MAG: NAD(P)-binding domain-containing protein, partial [Planctomycetaceae bacterium]|nr:NAD(P)-binding domain-containing protein [Planctomycetaceae bacterium]